MKFHFSPQLILFYFLFLGLSSLSTFGQQFEKRTVFVKKTNEKIRLDGLLDEAVWEKAEVVTDFWQMFPTDSLRSNNETTVRLLYDDIHIYF